MLPQKIKVRITDNEMADALRTALPDMTSADIENLQKDTRILEHLRATHGWILNEINALLYKHDLEGIVFDGHFQEYELEASKILLQMPDCASVDACQSVIHAVMVKSFSGIRYNCLLQEPFATSTLAREYASQWAAWRQEMRAFPWSQWDTEAMWAYILKAGGRVRGFTKKFVERWIELAALLPPQNSIFDECIIRQEINNKPGHARLRSDNRGEQVSGWIGIDRLNYRLPQAWRIVIDIHQAESGKEGTYA